MAIPIYVPLIAAALGYAAYKNKDKLQSLAKPGPSHNIHTYLDWINNNDDWRKGGERAAQFAVRDERLLKYPKVIALAKKILNSPEFIKADIFKFKQIVSNAFVQHDKEYAAVYEYGKPERYEKRQATDTINGFHPDTELGLSEIRNKIPKAYRALPVEFKNEDTSFYTVYENNECVVKAEQVEQTLTWTRNSTVWK